MLMQQLERVAHRVLDRCSLLMYTVQKRGASGDYSYAEDALSSTYLAYVQCGGDPDRPDQFNWASPDLFETAITEFRTLLRGRGSSVREHQFYLAQRITPDRIMTISSDVLSPLDEVIESEQQLDQLVPDLEQHLGAYDAQLLQDVYVTNVPRKVVATRAKRRRLSGGQTKVMAVHKAISRARQRARQALSDRWADVAKAVAA